MSSRIPFIAVTLCASLQAAAQVPPQEPRAPAPAYDSAFQGYRPFEAAEVQDWRQSNETVRAIGGWRAYAREIQGAPPAPGTGTAPRDAQPAAPDAARPHEGHAR